MEESIFEWMERTRFVDHALLVLAVAGPALVGALFFLFRRRTVVTSHAPAWAIAFIAAPVVLLLWNIYNRIADHYGIDSIFGIFVNTCVFLGAAVLLAVMHLLLGRTLPPARRPAQESHEASQAHRERKR
jgi:hypothetical protein